MKLSVSLTETDLAALDRYMDENDVPSRSAAVQRAIRLLDSKALAAEYAAEFAEWDGSPDQRLWDQTTADGIGNEAW